MKIHRMKIIIAIKKLLMLVIKGGKYMKNIMR